MEGILPLWKEKGMTSHDCVFKLRKILGTKKIGHAGTLDPEVDGVLPIAIGKATKVIEYMMDSGKVYEGEVKLGFSTTTEDAGGEIIEQKPAPHTLSIEEIDKEMKKMEGELKQTPPMYSAVKVNGKRLYEYARSGIEVERPTRKVTIESFERTSDPVYDEKNETLSWSFRVVCGKGTYVRTLAVDLGKKLGFPAHMSRLTRTESAGCKAFEAVKLQEVQEAVTNGRMNKFLKPLESGLAKFDSVSLKASQWEKVKNGALLPEEVFDVKWPAVFYYQEKAVAIYDIHPKKETFIKPVKVFRTEIE